MRAKPHHQLVREVLAHMEEGKKRDPSKLGWEDWACEKLDEIYAKAQQEAIKQFAQEVKQEMRQHTVPEGKHLITRSYLENVIDFKLKKGEQK